MFFIAFAYDVSRADGRRRDRAAVTAATDTTKSVIQALIAGMVCLAASQPVWVVR